MNADYTPAGVIYNVTVKVEDNIADQWLNWLLKEHIPEIIRTGCFHEYRVSRLLETDDSEGPTYAIQYYAASHNAYKKYIDQYANEMRSKSFEKWGNRFIAFRSLMEVVK